MNSTSDFSLFDDDVKVRSLWSDAFGRFRQNRGAVIGLGVLLFMVLVAIFARISLWVGVIAVGIAGSVGIPLGLLSAYYLGWMDALIMRLVDILLAFPGMLLALAIMAILGPDLINAMIAAGMYILPDYIRVTRGSVLPVKEMEYVMSARAIGSSDLRIMIRHILPNALLPLVVLATLQVASTILFISALSFLGLGARPLFRHPVSSQCEFMARHRVHGYSRTWSLHT